MAEETFYYNDPTSPKPNVPLKPGVAAILFDDLDRILVFKRTRGPYWCIPGGRQDLGESAQDCCIRETFEETGLTTEVSRLVGLYTNPLSICSYPDGNVHQSYIALFECRIISGELTTSNESREFQWMSRDELENFQLLPDNVLCCLDAWKHQPEAFIR